MNIAKKFLVSAIVFGAVFSFQVARAEEAIETPSTTDLWKMILNLKDMVASLEAKLQSPAQSGGTDGEAASGETGLIGFNYRKDMAFARIATTDFASVPERTVWYEKRNDNSILKVTYDDSFGVTFREKGDCRWRLTVDGERMGREKAFAPVGPGGSLVTDRQSSSISWIVADLPKGFYNFTIQARRSMLNALTTRCDNGWQDDLQENSLMVEELLK